MRKGTKSTVIPTDLEGKQIGYLKILKFDHRDEHSNQIWQCYCEACGNYVLRNRHSFMSGTVKSCGCHNYERSPLNRKRSNSYDLTGEYGIGYTKKGEPFYFDLEDYNKIKDYSWYISHGKKGDSRPRVMAHIPGAKTSRNIRLHRLVLDVFDEKYKKYDVDHINHDTCDNRKENLRLVTRTQNNMNMSTRKHSTPYKGIQYNEKKKRWTASIKLNGKNIYLITTDNLEEAIRVRKEAEEKYFGEYAYNQKVVDAALSNKK